MKRISMKRVFLAAQISSLAIIFGLVVYCLVSEGHRTLLYYALISLAIAAMIFISSSILLTTPFFDIFYRISSFITKEETIDQDEFIELSTMSCVRCAKNLKRNIQIRTSWNRP
ncbi:MAG: hypothetical protein QY310_04650 [Candidatus Jettenia sp. CY-1]|nr:hypothetical protein [Candidatus Jettenia sp.]WKZ19853.1 MAG: hypothetical protein QY310_04650 [Candidatus Jettenia sp. CY-1]